MNEQTRFENTYEAEMHPVTKRLRESTLQEMRATAIGGSSVSAAIVLVLLQTGVDGNALKFSLFCSALAIPAWIAAWQYVQAYLFYGSASLAHFNTLKGSGTSVLFAVSGMGLLVTSLSALIWHMSPLVAILFAVAALLTSILVTRHNQAVRSAVERIEGQSEK